jgi:hypothetical protein
MMKNLNFIFAALILYISLDANGQINQDCNGNVLIGPKWTTPSQKLYVNGLSSFTCYPASSGFSFDSYSSAPMITPQWNNSMYLGRSDRQLYRVYTRYLHVDGVLVTSDKKLKENIRPLESSMNNILKLNPVKFDYKADLFTDSLCANKEKLLAKRKDYSGFIAQEVQTVFPKLVEYNDEADILEINFLGFIPELVNAIKEQQIIIESLQSEIQELKKGSGSKLKSATTTGTSTLEENTTNALYQNAPNPFSQSTTIEYSIAENVQKAMICIYDMNGTQLKCIPLHLTGYGNITINGSELISGMYMYSLIADGQLIDTKRMILTD